MQNFKTDTDDVHALLHAILTCTQQAKQVDITISKNQALQIYTLYKQQYYYITVL